VRWDFRYSGHYWPIVPVSGDRWWWLWRNWWNKDWQGKPKYSEKTCPSATFYLVCEVIDTAATPGLLCQSRVIVKMIVEKQMEWRMVGETEVLRENLPQRHLCPSQNPTWPDSCLNAGRRGGKPATNHLSYGAALTRVVTLYFTVGLNICYLNVTIHLQKGKSVEVRKWTYFSFTACYSSEFSSGGSSFNDVCAAKTKLSGWQDTTLCFAAHSFLVTIFQFLRTFSFWLTSLLINCPVFFKRLWNQVAD
jgi:hypothetical protein